MKLLRLAGALAAYAAFGAVVAAAHRGLAMEQDQCRPRIGPYSMHFSGYQPERTLYAEFCEDIPATGRTILVLDAVDYALRGAEIGVRIVEDRRREPAGDATAPIVLDLPPRIYESGSVLIETAFNAPGAFVGLVAARSLEVSKEIYVARFPFAVGGSAALDFYAVFEIASAFCGAAAVIYVVTHVRGVKNAASG